MNEYLTREIWKMRKNIVTTPGTPVVSLNEVKKGIFQLLFTSCGCNNAGTQSRTCNEMTGTWGSWGACSGETGECVPGTREDGDCPAPYVGGPSQRICSDSCQWSAWDMRYCKEPDPCDTDPNGEACCRSKPECHWNSSKRYCDCQGGSSGGSSCTWRTVRTYSCGTNVPASACAGYSKCSINDYCPGGGIRVEACL